MQGPEAGDQSPRDRSGFWNPKGRLRVLLHSPSKEHRNNKHQVTISHNTPSVSAITLSPLHRFKIKPPPPSTGIKASYTPHPIAAGMSASFRIEIYAVPVGVAGERGQGRVQHSLEIVSEVNSLQLPVTATVLTAATYEEASLTLAKGVSLLPAKASSATGSQRL